MDNTLFLRLEAPYQSWGERARWTVRDTAPEPTKSGVVGLLSCALGITEDADINRISRSIRFGVRCDWPGEIMVDFHTVVGGILSADGKIKADTQLTERSYIYDASFLVVIQSTADQIKSFSEAVRQPIWPYYLGRKSCIPSRPVFEGTGEYDDPESALRSWAVKILSGRKEPALPIRAVVEAPAGQGVARRDEIKSNRYRIFYPRYTREVYVKPPIQEAA